MFDALSPARRRFVVAVGVCAIAVLLAAGGLALDWRQPSVTPVPQDAEPPVVLVPGYGGSSADLAGLAEALERAGRTTMTVNLGRMSRRDLHVQADLVDDAVKAVRASTGSRSVDLVGYSAGGVVVRVWLADHGGSAVARRILTLGSPHHGTELAGLAADLGRDACPEGCQQLAPGSALLRALNAGDETPPGPVWVSIWTSQDKTVVPPSSAELRGALAFSVQAICPGVRVSHRELPSHPTVVALVMAALGRALPERPGGEVCEAVSR